MLFGEVNESFRAYKVGVHQHTPEIEVELGRAAGAPLQLLFTPHLVPMNRGILTTAYLTPRGKISDAAVRDAYRNVYEKAPFVRLMGAGKLADTKNVAGLNFCDISFVVDERTNTIVVVSAIDNLLGRRRAGGAEHEPRLRFPRDRGASLNVPGRARRVPAGGLRV